ncbi:MAG TPA: DUF2877 domain-containing protein [Actinomycetota bacterium]|nr:DUF2877 domain-containing protein [Actinomycetota bacterium]
MARRLELGLGASEVLAVPGTGRVAGVYSKAVYLRMPSGLAALTTFDVPSGPVHARTSLALHPVRTGDRVVVTPSLVQAGPVLVELSGAEGWVGRIPGEADLASSRALAIKLLRRARLSALEQDLIDKAAGLVAGGDIAGAAAALGGAGPGLTPAGDDCLAGILFIASLRSHGPGRSSLDQLAAQVPTNEISLAFLRWAARSQSIEPVHRFLVEAARGDAEGAERAVNDLTSFGHSSGADLGLGLRLGLEALV